MKLNFILSLMALTLVVLCLVILHRMYSVPQPLLQPSNIIQEDPAMLWKPSITATGTPNQSFPVSEPVQPVVKKQCFAFLNGQNVCN